MFLALLEVEAANLVDRFIEKNKVLIMHNILVYEWIFMKGFILEITLLFRSFSCITFLNNTSLSINKLLNKLHEIWKF